MVGREGVLGTAGTTAGADGITGMAGVLGTGVAGVTTGAGIVGRGSRDWQRHGGGRGVVGGLTGSNPPEWAASPAVAQPMPDSDWEARPSHVGLELDSRRLGRARCAQCREGLGSNGRGRLVPSRGAGWVAAAPGSKTGMVGAKVVLGFGLGFAAGPESKMEDEGLKTGDRLRRPEELGARAGSS